MHTRILLSLVAAGIMMMPDFCLRAGAASSRREVVLTYFGTYTGAKSKGIYVSQLDLATGQLSTPELAAESASPSYLAIHPNHHYLYAVNETGNFGGKKSGAVTSFAIDPLTGKLLVMNQQPSGGDGPCHVNVDHSGKDVLVANYGSGSCSVFPVQKDGRLAPASAFMQHHGSSVNKSRQEGPHAHGIYPDPLNRFVFVADLGLDEILSYKFDPNHGTLMPNDPPFATVAPGSGPRHLAFHPTGRYAYVISEMACTITAFQYDASQGRLESFQTVSTLPEGVSVLPSYSTAEIHMHPNGKFVYGSNRGHNTIAVFGIDQATGRLTPVEHQSTQGKTPRGFGIDPTGHYLIAGNQDSDTVVGFRIDPNSGRLTPTGQTVQVGAPVCVEFLPLDR
jgi:6-phosphogluconolactonase